MYQNKQTEPISDTSSEYDSSGTDDTCESTDESADSADDDNFEYLYVDEPEPEPIYQVIFLDQAYCILCDKKYPPPSPSCIHSTFLNNTIKTFEIKKTKPYICSRICSLLAHHYYKVFPGSGTHTISIKNLRYVKNQVMTLYTGHSDTNSNFNVFNMDIIKFIIGKILDIVAGHRY